ncbi:nucleoside diphosphate kinase 6 isoform X7 [Rhineura floridana]|uniref:nucleoside diphosphate kinase 6 isoform X7 n=1 Tax=Rhineura floridana TaxID=261503 RepID=UPI002AC80D19|nr:nucleoside diphosphate kinase 6 isoform X7 [Rhineura floridana]
MLHRVCCSSLLPLSNLMLWLTPFSSRAGLGEPVTHLLVLLGCAQEDPEQQILNRQEQGSDMEQAGEPAVLQGALSGPMRAYILAHEEAISLWRSLMGPTKVFHAQHTDPESIRGAFGLTDTRNTVHGSDSAASASREIAFFFPDFSEEDWYRNEEPQLRGRAGCSDIKAIVHVPRDGWTEAD